MQYQFLFTISNNLALLSWLFLLIFSNKQWVSKWLICTSILMLCLLYSFIVITSFESESFQSFGSLDGIMTLFTKENAVLAGWIHYLAFDLLTGLYINSNARALGIQKWLVFPSLLLTFMLGPFGLLTYLLIRTIQSKKYLQY